MRRASLAAALLLSAGAAAAQQSATTLWLGAGNWDIAATASGHVDLDDGRRLTFEADQQPHTEWMYDVGVSFMPTPHWQLFADFGSDFDGGYYLVLGPTYRF